MRYRVFKRSATNWRTFASGRKMTEATNCSLEEAKMICDEFNKNRNARQIRKGTMMEFEQM